MMKRIDLANLFNSLSDIKGTFSKYLYYSIEKTKTNLKKEYDIIGKKENELLRLPEVQAFENDRMQLIHQCCEKDEKGEPIFIIEGTQTSYRMEKQKDEFEAKLKELVEINTPHLDKLSRNRLEFTQWLEEEVEVNVVKTSFKYLPDEINKDQIDTLMKLINDTP